MQLKNISRQVVVVMGASSGIGRETARRFAQQGAKVVVSARNETALQTLVAEIERLGGTATAIAADVRAFEQMEAVARGAVEIYGRLDTWVHLAGISVYGKFDELSPDEFKQVIDVNLTGQAYGAMAALPHLKREGRGALIHVSSGLARRAVPLQSAYCSSKHGMIGWLDSLRTELAHDGYAISVTNVMPASINTPFFDHARTKTGRKPKPIPPVYEPHLAAEVILYAAEHPIRDITAGGAAKALILGNSLAPRLLDAYFARTGIPSQQTDEPKSADVPDNLAEPLPGDQAVRGAWGKQALNHSLSNWLEMHPRVRRAIAGATLATIAVLTTRGLRRLT